MDTILRDALETGAGPKYRRIAAGVEAAIRTGALAPEERLPAVRDLAWRLGVTPGTVARAFALLSDAGWVSSEVGRGTFVRGERPPAEPGQVAGAPRASVPPDARGDGAAAPLAGPPYPELPDVGDVLFAGQPGETLHVNF